MRSQRPQQEPVFHAGIMLSDDVCQLMLIRYGGPDLQMDFVSFVHLMLRVENMEGELGMESGPGLPLLSPWIACLSPVQAKRGRCQCRELWGTLALFL